MVLWKIWGWWEAWTRIHSDGQTQRGGHRERVDPKANVFERQHAASTKGKGMLLIIGIHRLFRMGIH
jgi:hypothetical protein